MNPCPPEQTAGHVQLLENMLGLLGDKRQVFAVSGSMAIATGVQHDGPQLRPGTHRPVARGAGRRRALAGEFLVMPAVEESAGVGAVALSAGFRLPQIVERTFRIIHWHHASVRFGSDAAVGIAAVTVTARQASFLVR